MKLIRRGLLLLLAGLCTNCHYLHIPPSYNLIMDGNSLVADLYGNFTGILGTDVRQMLHKHWQSNRVDVFNIAVSGQTTKQMLVDAATQVDSLCSRPSLQKSILVAWENYNDLRVDPACSGRISFERMRSYCQGRKRANPQLLIIVGTPPDDKSRLCAWPTSPTFEARRAECRSLLVQARANHEKWLDALADTSGDTVIDADDGMQSPDGIHYVDRGYVLIARRFSSAVEEALFHVPQPAPFLKTTDLAVPASPVPKKS